MHTDFALLCFVVVIHWLIFPYPSGLLHWHCGNLTIAPVPAKQHLWIWINASCEFIMNDCITTTKQSTTKPCAYFLGYAVRASQCCFWVFIQYSTRIPLLRKFHGHHRTIHCGGKTSIILLIALFGTLWFVDFANKSNTLSCKQPTGKFYNRHNDEYNNTENTLFRKNINVHLKICKALTWMLNNSNF